MKPYVYLYSEAGEIIDKKPLDIDLMKLLEDQKKSATVTFDTEELKSSKLEAGIGVVNPETGEPEVYLDMDAEYMGYIYKLY